MTNRIIDEPSDQTTSRAGWAYLRQIRDGRFDNDRTWIAAQVLDDEVHWARSHRGTVTVHASGFVNIGHSNPPASLNPKADSVFQPLHPPAKVTRVQARDLSALLDRGYGTFSDDRKGRRWVDVTICYSIPTTGWQVLFDRGWVYELGGRVVVSFGGRIALAMHEAREAGLHGDKRQAFIREAADAHRIP